MFFLQSKKVPAILLAIPTLLWASYLSFNFPPYAEWEPQVTVSDSINSVSDTGNDSLSPISLVYDEHTPPSDNWSETPTVTAQSPTQWVPEATPTKPENVSSLSKGDTQSTHNNCHITQREDEHVTQWQWSVYAIDLHCGTTGNPQDVYFPTGKKYFEILAIGNDERIGDYIILKHWDIRYVFWHTVTSRKQGDKIDIEKDWNILGQENKSGMWNWYHAHIEQWKCPTNDSPISDCQNVSSTWEVNTKSDKLIEQRGWKPIPSNSTELKTEDTFDLDKLASAVARAETSGCTKWSALSHNNCFGIMTWDKNGKRSFKRYASHEESFADFKRIWSSYYGWFPTLAMAKKWTGADRAERWLWHVKQFYAYEAE